MNSTTIDMNDTSSAALSVIDSLIGRTMIGARIEAHLNTAVTVRFADGDRMTVLGDSDCCQSMTIALRSYVNGTITAVEVAEPQRFGVNDQGYADGELRDLIIHTDDGARTVIRMSDNFGGCMYHMETTVEIDSTAFIPNDFSRR